MSRQYDDRLVGAESKTNVTAKTSLRQQMNREICRLRAENRKLEEKMDQYRVLKDKIETTIDILEKAKNNILDAKSDFEIAYVSDSSKKESEKFIKESNIIENKINMLKEEALTEVSEKIKYIENSIIKNRNRIGRLNAELRDV